MENISSEKINLLPNDFNVLNYKNLYDDLLHMNEEELKYHYINYGINENRIYKITLPYDFNCNNYRFLNYDLVHISDEHIKNHYIEFGYYEKRIYKINLPKDFISVNYKFLNNDLSNMDDEELKTHYINHGFYENRLYKINLPEDFNYISYKELNQDLLNMNDDELKDHYINYGFYENRFYKIILPEDFNIDYYRQLNNDLYNLNDLELKNHYINNGYNENRIYDIPFDFNWISYLNKNKLYNLNYSKIEILKYINFTIKNNILYDEYNINNDYKLNEIDYCNSKNIKYNDKYEIITNDTILNNIKKYSFIIVTSKYGIAISNSIKSIFDKFKINSKIVFNINDNDISENKYKIYEIFIILFPQLLEKFPIKNKYIIYQLEQIVQSNWMNNILINNITNSLLTLDYSLYNINNFYKFSNNILNNKLYYFPMPIINYLYENENKNEYDIIFYGGLNKRRKDIINNLKNKYNIYYTCYLYGNDIYNLIKKSKIILNLHYYKNANLEVARINEIIIYNKIIISEIPQIHDENIELYMNNIIFIDEINNDLSNIDILYQKIDFYLDNNNYKNYLNNCNNKNFIKNIYNRSLYYMNLATNNISNSLNNKIAIICCNYGNYDVNENDINILNNNNIFDWYYFTDLNISLNKWNIINTDYHTNNINYVHNNDVNRMISKYYKFQSINIDIITKYEYIIWMDTAVMIENINFIDNIIKLINNNNDNDLFMFEHYQRDNIKDELLLSINLNKYKNQNLVKQVKNYIRDGLIDNKLYETGFIIYKNNEKIKNFMNYWWNEIILYGYQCQISAPYVLYKNNINPYILNDNNFKKGYLEGSVWRNNLYGHVKFNHNNNENIKYVVDYNKINGIDNILWINLDRSLERKIHMENLLKNLNVNNTRIIAIDGKNNNIRNITQNLLCERNLSDYEIACTLSHIKAINFIKNLEGNYFLICEDDISFNNISIFEEDLDLIIKESPDFDILLLYKTYLGKLNKTYEKWSDYYKEYPTLDFIGGAVAYIVSKNNILNKLNNFTSYVNDTEFLFNSNKIDVSELYIFKNFNTYVYKYNYINTLNNQQSTIHEDHIELHDNISKKELNLIKDEYLI